MSTDEVYGSLGSDGMFTETSRYDPRSPYSASKAASDHLVRAYHTTYGLPVIVTHCSNNYGPFQFPEKLMPLMISNALKGEPLPVYGDGRQVRDWIHVDDHCRALRTALQRGVPGQTYNVGARCERANLEVVQAICDLVDLFVDDLPRRPCRHLITFVRDRPGHDQRYAIDPSKIETELSWKPLCPFEEGLRTTVQWYIENPAWMERALAARRPRSS